MRRYRPNSAAVSVIEAERALVAHLRGHAGFVDQNYRTPPGQLYATPEHLLLAHGRLFDLGRRPADIGKMRDRFCFQNAATAARRHGLLYAEGIAVFSVTSGFACLPHAWCVTSHAAVVDPTWDDGAGQAYLGITLADPDLWPTDNRGLLHDHQRSAFLLRGELSLDSNASLGRAVPAPPA